jgi:putative transposase
VSYHPKPPPPEERALKHPIDALYPAHPFYGSRKLSILLEPTVGPITRKRLQRYMRELAIAGIAAGPNRSNRLTEQRGYPYLLRDLTAHHPKHSWGCDITDIRLRHGWLYLVAIIDWCSRYMISWMLDATLQRGFVLAAIGQARARAIPQIWNTAQGRQFTSPPVSPPLEAAGVQIRMDGTRRALDTLFTERLGRSLK